MSQLSSPRSRFAVTIVHPLGAPRIHTKRKAHTHYWSSAVATLNGPPKLQRVLETTPNESAAKQHGNVGIHRTGLTVSRVDDATEREADVVADRIMRMSDTAITESACDSRTLHRAIETKDEDEHTVPMRGLGGGCPSCGISRMADDERIAKSTENASSPRHQSFAVGGQNVPTNVAESIAELHRNGGTPLPRFVRQDFEGRFGRDFNRVRVHTGEGPATVAQQLHAKAFTLGSDVVFGRGQFEPTSETGKRLLAHELTHVIQQTNRSVNIAQRDALTNDPPEQLDEDVNLPKGPPRLNPNKAPTCADICGSKDKCQRGPGENCSPTVDAALEKAWQSAANNLTKAIDHMINTPDSPTLTQSLKDNFGWNPGKPPRDLPAQVKNKLNDALSKISDSTLCTRCRPCDGVSRVERGTDGNCLGSNCFVICKDFEGSSAETQAHALLHELMHRVVRNSSAGEVYKGQSGYPPIPPSALNNPDSFASLVDDLR
jgi:hypothetical protein